MIPAEWLDQAVLRIAPHIRRTLLTNDAELNLYLKWENMQVTGSFKARGALNKVLALEPWERERGLVSASAGNHGQGVALAAQVTGAAATVFAPEHATPVKLEAMRRLGAWVLPVPGGYEQAEKAALAYAAEHALTWVSAYNDGQVIAGQGTIGLEILQDLPAGPRQTWLVPVGGGGMLAGIGAALERVSPRPRLVGVNAQASAFFHALYHRDSQEGVADLPTLADGLSGAIEPDALTIPMVRRYADDLIVVSEDEIAHAIAFAWQHYAQIVEGSAAVGLAAVLCGKVRPPAVVVVSGGNIQPGTHAEILRRYAGGK